MSKYDNEICIYSQCHEWSLRQLNTVRRLLGHTSRVRFSVFLHLSADSTRPRCTAKDWSKEQTLSCWFAENIKGIYLTSQQADFEPFISKLLKRNTPVLLARDLLLSKISTLKAASSGQNELERLFEPFFNIPQLPLEPLRDSLHAHTYRNFEQDIAKYNLYEKAIRLALERLSPRIEPIRLAVVGAGRGPLVDAVLTAGRSGPIIIIEKNADALDTLRYRLRCEWHPHSAQITILDGDASHLKPPFPCTVVVSELLASFGDNELCPEILNSMRKHGWYEENAINTPQSYCSFLMPCYAPQIRDNLSRLGLADEAAYAVLPRNSFIYDKAVLNLPAFTHTDTKLCCSSFSAKSSFAATNSKCVTGFLGYFKTTLYGTVGFSTHPSLKEGAHRSVGFRSTFPSTGLTEGYGSAGVPTSTLFGTNGSPAASCTTLADTPSDSPRALPPHYSNVCRWRWKSSSGIGCFPIGSYAPSRSSVGCPLLSVRLASLCASTT